MGNNVRVNGLTADNATLLLAAAEELGQPAQVVQTQSDGYFLVPKDVASKAKVKFEEDDTPTEAQILPDREPLDDHGTTGTDSDGSENVKAAVEGQAEARAEASTQQAPAKKTTTAKKTAAKKTAAKKTAATAKKE